MSAPLDTPAPGIIWAPNEDGSLVVLCDPPIVCGVCGRMVAFAVNRYGRTSCADCDAARQMDGVAMMPADECCAECCRFDCDCDSRDDDADCQPDESQEWTDYDRDC